MITKLKSIPLTLSRTWCLFFSEACYLSFSNYSPLLLNYLADDREALGERMDTVIDRKFKERKTFGKLIIKIKMENGYNS